jgi:SAM-dependent methyltransferase
MGKNAPERVERDLAIYYNQEAEARANRELIAERLEARAAFISTYVPPGARLLEVGTGPGRDAGAFVAAGLATFGVDLSHEFAVFAAKTGAAMTNATARALPFRDGSFDVVWSMSTLMHIPDSAIEASLGELRRVLRPVGVAAIGVWGGRDVEQRLAGNYEPPRYFCRRSDDRWRSLLAAIGTVVAFDTWHREADEFYYQWAVVRRP